VRASEGKIGVMAFAVLLAAPALAHGQAQSTGTTSSAPASSKPSSFKLSSSPAKAGAPSRAVRAGSATKAKAAPLDPGLRRGTEEGGAKAASTLPPVATPTPAGTPPQPIGRVADWFEADSYPPQARAKAQEGQTVYAVDLDAQGRILRCNVVQSSGSDLLDSTTCTQVISNGRFRPARDAAGKPVAGRYQGSMRWKLVDGPASE